MADIILQPVGQAWLRVLTDAATFEELYDYFSFDLEIWQLNKRTGKRSPKTVPKHLLSKRTQFLPAGLYKHLLGFATERNLTVEGVEFTAENWAISDTDSLCQSLQLWAKGRSITPHEHQVMAITKALRYRRRVLLSATSSGKSLIAYVITRQLVKKGLRGLLIVPTIGLVNQMYADFEDYSTKNKWNVDTNVHKVFGGQDKSIRKPLTISTWQSLYDSTDIDLSQFDFVIGDEAHTFAASMIGSVMERLSKARYRIGMSGSLHDTKVHELSVIGHFGPIVQVITNKEQMDKGLSAQLTIKALVLKYPMEDCRRAKLMEYQDELDFLIENKYRNNFIVNLALSQKQNTLLLFQYVERHGKILYEELQKRAAPGRNVYFIYGGTEAEDRERIRQIVEKDTNAIIIASNGVFSTGVSINNLHSIIFTSPTKSKIRILQSIGRGLRLGVNKFHCTLFDIVDDLRDDTGYINYALKHFAKRMKLYQLEQFVVKVYNIALGG